MGALHFVVLALVISVVLGFVENTKCNMLDHQAGLFQHEKCVQQLLEDEDNNIYEHLTFTIRVKYPESVLKAHGSTSLYIRGNGLGLLWIKGKQLIKSGHDTWYVNITYSSSLDGYSCQHCLNHKLLPDNKLQYRIMADDLQDMLGANFVSKLPVSEVSSYFDKVPIFTVYPWFFTQTGSINEYSIDSTNLGSRKNVTFYTPPSFHENKYKRYPTFFVFDLNFHYMISFKSKIENPIYPHAVAEEFSLIGFGDYESSYKGRIDLLTPTSGPNINCVNGTFEDSCNGCVPFDIHANVSDFIKYLETNCGQYYTYGGQGDQTLDFLEKEAFPFLNQKASQRLQADNIGIMGYSLGGLMSCYAAWTRPNVYSFAACQSPSLWWPMNSSNHNVTDFDFLNKTLIDKAFQINRPVQKIYLDAGGAETPGPYNLAQSTIEAAHAISSFEHYELNRNVWVAIDPHKEHTVAEWKRRIDQALVTLLPAHGAKGIPQQGASSVG